MYFVLGPEENLQTLIALATPFMAEGAQTNATTMRIAYLHYLKAKQPNVPLSDQPQLVVVSEPARITTLAEIFGLEDTPPGKRSGFEALRDIQNPVPPWKHELLEDADRECSVFEPELGALLNLVIDSVFTTANSLAAGSMTTGRAVGIMWVDPLKNWAVFDVVEAYVHELTHTLLTLDEHRYGHYYNYERLRQPENLARSAIRAEPRPLNAVIHSFIVAEELLQFRTLHMPDGYSPRLHADTDGLRQKATEARDSIYSLPNLANLITPRLQDVLGRTDQKFSALIPTASATASR